MAEQDIVQHLIARPGHSQAERGPRPLDPASAPVEGRSAADLLTSLRALAARLNYYEGRVDVPAGTWASFLPDGDPAALLARDDGTVPPHLGLLATFLALYEHPTEALNRLTGRHLDFQYTRVLGFRPRPGRPDRAHLLIELRRTATPIAITGTHEFLAGKDASKVERVYRPVRDVVVGAARVDDLRSIHRTAARLHVAPIANSADGLGGPLDAADASWPPFGTTALPAAQPGFAIASPLLALAEGERRISIDLDVAGLLANEHTPERLTASLEAFVTGPKGWLGPFPLEATVSESRLGLALSLPTTADSVVAYDASAHGQSYATVDPILHVHLREDAAIPQASLASLVVHRARIRVKAEGLVRLELESDAGALDPRRAFQPFGAQPVPGSRFRIGCPEALAKPLVSLTVSLAWQGAPDDLGAWYRSYSGVARIKDGVRARVSYEDRTGALKAGTHDLMSRIDGVTTLTPTAPAPTSRGISRGIDRLAALRSAGSTIARGRAERLLLSRPLLAGRKQRPRAERAGVLTIELLESFLHAEYRRESIEHAIAQDGVVLNEPYTPTVRALSLSYEAVSDDVDLGAVDEGAFAARDVQFFHVGCFGQMREHAFLRAAAGFLDDRRVTLLPSHPFAGELLIGLSGLGANESVSLLVQVAEGSANPERTPQRVRWWALCDNYWRPLGDEERTLDTTRDLGTSGIVSITLPRETTTGHTILPGGRTWIRATVDADPDAACRIVRIAANAVEVAFEDRGNDPAHLATPLQPGTIAKMRAAPGQVAAVRQPFATFGGAVPEGERSLRVRASERLRHRGRALTAWDIEHLVLDAFPSLHRVKCIPHARDGSWFAPGHVLVVLVPDLRHRHAADPLRPRADLVTLEAVREFVQSRCPPQVTVSVRHPRFQSVRVECAVAMRRGFPFAFHAAEIDRTVRGALSPWAVDVERPIEFGGAVYRSALLDRVEELPCVDFVTGFRLRTTLLDGRLSQDLALVRALSPDAILVSDHAHAISQV